MSKHKILAAFSLRLSPEVKQWVERKASETERSQNYVIVQALKQMAKNETNGQTAV